MNTTTKLRESGPLVLHDAGRFPASYDYRYGDISSLGEWDVERVPSSVVEMWYWYAYGSYEGTGLAVLKYDDGTYNLHSMGHCSCYGPTDDMPDSGEHRSINELVGSMSSEYQKELEPFGFTVNAG